MNSEFYPVDWPQLAAEIKEANGFECQSCQVECRREPSDRSKPVLAVAHITQDYEADWVQLAPMCVRCHLIHDAPFGMQARRRNQRMRQRQAGQLTIFQEGKRE